MNLYLPITSQQRELDARLLLALFAKERGINPVLGYKSAFQCSSVLLSPGVYFAHNARRTPMRDLLSRCGHLVVVLDEEALVRQTDELFLKKHNKDAFKNVSRVFSWGQDDYELWKKSEFANGNIFITGNPRIDLLRPELRPFHEADIRHIRARFGDNYLLLNTNFPTVNNLLPQDAGIRLSRWARDTRGTQIKNEFLTHKKAIFERFLAVVPKLAKAIAPTALVVRPHPSEDHSPWINALKGLPNAHLVFEGNVVPWLAGARALIHNNCTTAVEAAVLGTQILSYRPISSDTYDNPLANAFGIECGDENALISAAREIVQGSHVGLVPEQELRLQHHIANVNGDLSCERILDVLSNLNPQANFVGFVKRHIINLRSNLKWISGVTWWYAHPEGRKRRRILAERFPRLKIRDFDVKMLGYDERQFELLERTFPAITIEDLDERIARIAWALNRFHGLRAGRFGRENLFTILS
jgi:surface carbohydrate biosynthesis protein